MAGSFEAQFKSNNNGKVYTAAPLMKEGKWDVAEVGILTHPAFVEAFEPEGGRESKLVAEMEAEIAAPKIPAIAASVDIEKPALAPEVAATLEAEELPPVAEGEPEPDPLPEPETVTSTADTIVPSEYGLPNGDADIEAIRASAAEETAAHEAELDDEEPAQGAEAPTGPGPAPVADERISASEAIELVKIETKIEALELWLKSDGRKSVKRAIRKRMNELQG